MNLSFLLLLLMYQLKPMVLSDFSSSAEIDKWSVVNDGVMGGVSRASLKRTSGGKALFSGHVSTENYGGFSSIRYNLEQRDISAYRYVVLRLKGDGKQYQFRLKETPSQRHSYIATFKTSGEWETIRIALASFYPGYRGMVLDIPNYSAGSLGQIGILIANKKEEDFSLEISSIVLEE